MVSGDSLDGGRRSLVFAPAWLRLGRRNRALNRLADCLAELSHPSDDTFEAA
jgi:hypothetical protein